MKKQFLFLDDTAARHERFDEICQSLNVEIWHVRTTEQAIRLLKKQKFDCVFLDHDLEETELDDTGFVVASFIALHLDPNKLPKSVVIHSRNPEGAERMETVLRDHGFNNVRRVPFSSHF